MRVGLVPQGDQLVPALADVLAVEDLAGEDTREIEPVGKAGIRPVVDRERAVQPDSGSPNTQPLHLDGAPGAAVFQDLVSQFLDGHVDRTLYQTGRTGSGAKPFGLLHGVALLDAGSEGIDYLDSRGHIDDPPYQVHYPSGHLVREGR